MSGIYRRKHHVAGHSFAGILASISIIGILAAILLVRPALLKNKPTQTKVDGNEPKTALGKAMGKGHSVECLNNLRGLRQLMIIELEKPAQLRDLNLPSGITPHCLVNNQPYRYNPSTGAIQCAQHPTH